jgi:hypothetical protein
VIIVNGNNALAIGHQSQLGGRSPSRPQRLSISMLWQEIATGLAIATIGIMLAVCVISAGVMTPRIAQQAPRVAPSLRLDTSGTVPGLSLPPPL